MRMVSHRRTDIWFMAFTLIALLNAGCGNSGGGGSGGGDETDNILPPLSELGFTIDSSLVPLTTTLPGILASGAPRPVAAIMDERGRMAEFIENELLLQTEDQDLLNDFVERWQGELLATFDPSASGLPGVLSWYVVRINTGLADASGLIDDLLALDPDSRGANRVSSEAALGLLAAGAREAAGGLAVGMSWIGYPAAITDRSITDAPTGDDGFTDAGPYSPDAFDWHHMNAGSRQDIGVTEAWWLLEQTGRIDNKVKIAIIDQGFADNTDLPKPLTISSVSPFTPGLLDQPGSFEGKRWHGTNVTHTAMAITDNGFGSAGVAGPVADPILIYSPIDYGISVPTALTTAFAQGARIVSMSFSSTVPASLSWTVLPFDALTIGLSNAGVLLFASAGNDGLNVDAEDCFIICWEEEWITPCENGGVICVGGMGRNTLGRDPSSNYGNEEVDLYAPYNVLVGPDPENPANEARWVRGTSFSSPYAAAVAALMWAANPGRSAGSVRSILFDTAHFFNVNSVSKPYVNAQAAVLEALGSIIVIQAPSDGSSVARGTTLEFSAFVSEAGRGAPTVTWESDMDGVIGSGTSFSTISLSFGTHTVTATADFPDGFSTSDAVQVTILNDPPIVTIESPAEGESFFQSQTINLQGSSFDSDNVPTFDLNDSQVSWFIDGALLGTGHTRTIPGGTVGIGSHTIRFEGTDGTSTVQDSVTIMIITDPADLPPNPQITNPTHGQDFGYPLTSDGGGFYTQVTLTGNATDPEDGTLTGSSLVWKVSSNGGTAMTVGTGASVSAKLYATTCGGNSHVISLTATDSGANAITVTVTVTNGLLC